MVIWLSLTTSLQYFFMYVYPFLKLDFTSFTKWSSFPRSETIGFFSKKLVMKSSGVTTSSETQTIPHRLTVAGDAWLRSLTSKSILILLLSLIRSPLERQSIIESSRTVLRFSTHIASTGPSNKMYSWLVALALSSFAASPSVQFWVNGSKFPYSYERDTDFGFKVIGFSSK